MNKSQLVTKLSEQSNIPRKKVEQVVNIIFETISDTLVKGDRVEVRGFGSFSTKLYEPYTGRNPRTGIQIQVPAKRLPFFKAGKETKVIVDRKPSAAENPPPEQPASQSSPHPQS